MDVVLYPHIVAGLPVAEIVSIAIKRKEIDPETTIMGLASIVVLLKFPGNS
jgi:hypothetical protein